MGHYQMLGSKGNTKANRKDPKYIEVFNYLRDLEYTVSESNMIAGHTCYYLMMYPHWTIEQAIREVLK